MVGNERYKAWPGRTTRLLYRQWHIMAHGEEERTEADALEIPVCLRRHEGHIIWMRVYAMEDSRYLSLLRLLQMYGVTGHKVEYVMKRRHLHCYFLSIPWAA